MKSVLALVLAISGTSAVAQAPDQSEARDGDFGAKLLVTDNPDGFWREWDQPGNPTVTTTKRISRARPVAAMVLFHDCRPAADGNCNLTVRFDMTAPDGRPYGSHHEAVAWKGPPASNHNIQASLASMGFRLEPKDQLGPYTIIATLTDVVAGKSLALRQLVTAMDEAPTTLPAT